VPAPHGRSEGGEQIGETEVLMCLRDLLLYAPGFGLREGVVTPSGQALCVFLRLWNVVQEPAFLRRRNVLGAYRWPSP
jgi:hypothetical protein